MFEVEQSTLGRIVVPRTLPEGFALFYTTLDFHGRLDRQIERRIADVIRSRFSIEATLNTCTQVHGVAVQKVQRSSSWRECDSCDALWSDEKHVALGIKIADCLPVSIIEPTRGIIANIHSGWRGAAQGITARTLDLLGLESAYTYLGPSIRGCCFEVGEEVAVQFAERYIDRTRKKPHVDLPALTVDILRNKGFSADKIFDSGLCARCNGSIFHSFRRDGSRGGRNLAIVAQ